MPHEQYSHPAALRRLVYERANGCCEYCLTPEAVILAAHEADHIIAEKQRRPYTGRQPGFILRALQ